MERLPQVDFCLLIPHYNNPQGLLTSLQTVVYKGAYCVLVVDDGSTEPPQKEALLQMLPPGFPLHIMYLQQNSGITAALNAGLSWIKAHCKSQFIARLDCSDTCDPNRFEAQVRFMQDHPDIGLLGSWCRFFNPVTGKGYTYKTVTSVKAVWQHMHLRNVLIHPTVLFRATLLQQVPFYPTVYPHAEDYGFFWELMQYSKAAVLPEVLVNCYMSGGGISARNRKRQLRSVRQVIERYGKNKWLRRLGFFLTWTREITPFALILRLKQMQKAEK